MMALDIISPPQKKKHTNAFSEVYKKISAELRSRIGKGKPGTYEKNCCNGYQRGYLSQTMMGIMPLLSSKIPNLRVQASAPEFIFDEEAIIIGPWNC